MNVWKHQGTEYFVIGTQNDTPGIQDWKVYLVDMSNGKVQDITGKVTINETEHEVRSPATGTVDGETLRGSKVMKLKTGQGAAFRKGMKIAYSTGGGGGGVTEYNQIKFITGDTITLKSALRDTVSDSTTVTQTGKTGDYRCAIDLSKIEGAITVAPGGDYQLQVTSAAADIDITSEMFHVTDYSINDDLGDDIKKIKNELAILTGNSSTSAKIFL